MQYAHPPPTVDVALPPPTGLPAWGLQPPALPRSSWAPASGWTRLAAAWYRCGYALTLDGRLEALGDG